MQFQKTVTSFKKLSRVSKNCHEFQITVTSFKKLSRVSKNCHKFHVQFQKKLSHLTIVVVKRSVILKKKVDYNCWFWLLAKKLFFEFQNVETHVIFSFLAEILELHFFFQNFFSNLQFWINFSCIIFFRFFQTYPTISDFIKLKWNWEQFYWNYLKLFETICNCHSFTETGCKKKVVIGIKSAKSPVSLFYEAKIMKPPESVGNKMKPHCATKTGQKFVFLGKKKWTKIMKLAKSVRRVS